MKKFDKFLKESKGDAEFKSGSFDMANTESQLRKSKERKINKRLSDLANKTKNEKEIVNRFFTDKPDSETLSTKSTGDESQFKSNKNVVNRELKKTIPGKSKKVTVGALDKRDAAIKRLDKITIEPQKGDATKTQNLIKDLEKKITKPKPGEISKSKELVKDLNPGTNTTIKPSVDRQFSTTQPSSASKNIGKNITTQTTSPKVITKSFSDLGKKSQNISKSSVTTNITKPVKFKSFLDRIGQATGVKNPIEKTLSKSDKITGLSGKDLKNLKGKVRAGGILKGAGRFATGAFAVKDAYDKARIEKAKGRGKTSQVFAGLARGAGGYIGGAIGATLGTVAGGGFGSAVLGTGGAIAGYNLGTKAGDYLYKKGRQIATGKTFRDFMKNIRK